MDKKLTLEERFKAQQKLSKLPRNSAKVRVRNRCQITGRPHGVYRKLKISRIALRQLGLKANPGMVKSSWQKGYYEFKRSNRRYVSKIKKFTKRNHKKVELPSSKFKMKIMKF